MGTINVFLVDETDNAMDLFKYCDSGAEATLSAIVEADKEKELMDLLEAIRETWEENQLRTFLWNKKKIFDALGMSEEDFACGGKGKKKFSDDAIFMFPETGAVGTYDEWWYDEIDEDGSYTGKQLNAVDRGEVVEVVKDKNGDWVEKENLESVNAEIERIFACFSKQDFSKSRKPILRKKA